MSRVEISMTNEQVIALAAVIGTCIMMGLEAHLKPHSLMARKIKKVEQAIMELAGLNGGEPLPKEMLDLGAECWSEAMEYLGRNIKD